VKYRLFLNGKRAADPLIRDVVNEVREKYELEVRVTYEYGDIFWMAKEASVAGIKRVIVGGGDGTINEAVNAIAKQNLFDLELGILPIGTANDFATSAKISPNPFEALKDAIENECYKVDIIKANENFFLNVASGGFGAEVTAQTSAMLKRVLGGWAYRVTALFKLLDLTPYVGRIIGQNYKFSGSTLFFAVCNGRQAGGGQVIAPNAYIDDGLMDIFSIKRFSAIDIPQVLDELNEPKIDNKFVKLLQDRRVKLWLRLQDFPINFDGEPAKLKEIDFEVVPGVLKLALPKKTPLLKG